MKLKKVISVLIAVVMVIGILPQMTMPVKAAGEVYGVLKSDAKVYQTDLDNKTPTIKEIDKTTVNHLYVAEEVTQIVDFAFISHTALKTVEIRGETLIGQKAFLGCANLTAVTMPKVTTVGAYAFRNCTALSNLTVGATPPITVGTDAFSYCPTSRSLLIDGGNTIDNIIIYKAVVDEDVNDNLWYGWTLTATVNPPLPNPIDISKGQIIVEDGTNANTIRVTYNENVQKAVDNLPLDTEINITGTTTSDAVAVNATKPVNITLSTVNINVSSIDNKCAFDIQNNSVVNLTLADETTNILKSGRQQAGLQVQTKDGKTATVTIKGKGSIEVTGGTNGAAGIGGGGQNAGGRIFINDGKVTATSVNLGAGIGSSYFGAGSSIIAISGGTVTATGGQNGAGIGGGQGGRVGETGSGGNITISGGTVTGIGGSFSAGIGGGYTGSGGNITISGGSVIGVGGSFGGGIGGGGNVTSGIIKIDKTANVIAVSDGTKNAINDFDKIIESSEENKPVANILMANYAVKVDGNVAATVKKGEIEVGTFTPTIAYKSIAFSVPDTGEYTLYKGATKQAHNTPQNNKTFALSVAGLNAFLEAKDYVPKIYKVTVNNGTGSNDYTEDDQVTIVANTPQAGKQFKAWTVVSGGATLTNVTNTTTTFTMPASAVEVTATYEDIPAPKTYTVTYNANGGSETMLPQSFTEGIPQTLTANTFKRTDYTFAGWNTLANGTGTSYADGASYTATASITLYAQWEEITPPQTKTVTVHSGTGSGDYSEGSIVTIKANTPPAGKQFKAWTIQSEDLTLPNATSATTTFIMPACRVEVTATYEDISTTSTVSGTVEDDDNNKVSGATVKLMKGNSKIGETTTAADGKFTFTDVTNGTYNLVVSKDGIIVTTIIVISGKDYATGTIKLPSGKTNSVVEVKPNTPQIVVGNLENQFIQADKDVVTGGGSVEIKLVAEAKNNTAPNAGKITATASANEKTVGQFIDLSVFKTTTPFGGTPSTTTLGELSTLVVVYIPLDTALRGKTDYVIYRYHGSAVDTITTAPNGDSEKIELVDGGAIIKLTTKKFSTYAIAYKNTTGGGSTGGGSTGGTGGGSTDGGSEKPPVEKPLPPKKPAPNPQTGDSIPFALPIVVMVAFGMLSIWLYGKGKAKNKR